MSVSYTKDKEGRVIAAHSHQPTKQYQPKRRDKARATRQQIKQTPLERLESLFI